MPEILITEKPPGGKLFRVKLRLEGGRIARLRVEGDFFIHPEEALEAIEAVFLGGPATKRAVGEMLDSAVQSHPAQWFGITPDDLKAAIEKGIQEAGHGE
ncbi:MAG: biotin--protein ligase [Alphaproteobacteria bacterium CG_4_10_14_0_2_um_filter_63_37]|nr:MAG: hypothetical protein AUJ55_04885 [Proteobacteria bacterium CG1_02_64_396]PJA23813.1 MAG: biotin--protein ligase [Alphaproteobacteria bacterium CG_4_10_14_0_2_um_filter_63_37]